MSWFRVLRIALFAICVSAAAVAVAGPPSAADQQAAIDEASTRLEAMRAEVAANQTLDEGVAETVGTYFDRAERALARAQDRLDDGKLERSVNFLGDATGLLDKARTRIDTEVKA